MANRRTYINADEELIIQGKLTIEGEIEQKQTTIVNNYAQSNFEGEQLIVNSDGVDGNGDAVAGTLTLKHGVSVHGNLTVDANGTLVIPGALEVTGQLVGEASNAAYANVAGIAATANALTTTRTFIVSGDASSTAQNFNGTQNVDLAITLANSGVSAGVYGSDAIVPVITVDSKGRLTNVANTTISITSSEVSDFTTEVNSLFDTRLATKTTSDLTEGTNLYYTQARFDTAFSAKSTTNLSEGTNLYYTTTRANTDFDTRLATKDTGDLTEGTNLYFTTDRANSAIDNYTVSATANVDSVNGYTGIVSLNTDDIPDANATNKYYDDGLARLAISVNDIGGDGSLSYSNTSGIITYTGPSLAEIQTRIDNSAANVQSHFTGGDGIDFNTGDIAVDGTVIRNSGTQTIAGTMTFSNTVNVQGEITVPTLAQTDNSTKAASTAYVRTAVSDLIDNAPAALDTLNELAAALNDDANIGGIVSNNTTRIGTLESRNIYAGNGLIGGGDLSADRTFNVGTGTGITVNADSIEVDMTAFTTSDLTEGTNLYYTQGRFDTAFSNKDTDNLSEGSTNVYWTQTRFDNAFGAKTTTDLTEGTNLYYTQGRFDTAFSNKDTDDLSQGGTNKYYASSLFDADLATKTTTNLTEGSNLYFTTGRATDAVEGYLIGGDGIDYSSGTIAVDSSVVRTSGDQSIAGNIEFTGELIMPQNGISPANEGSIFHDGTDVFAVVNGVTVKLTPQSDVGEVETVGTGEAELYAGYRTVSLGNANVKYHGVKSISTDSIIDLTEASNVITLGANSTTLTAFVRNAISHNDTGGDGSFSYSNTSGIFTYTGPSASEVRSHFTAGTGITITNGEIAATGDNFNSWVLETDSGAGSAETVTSNEKVTFTGGTNITVTNSGNVITITNDNVADITAVTAGNGLTGGGNNGAVTLNVGSGTGVTVTADAISIGQDVATTANVEFNSVVLSPANNAPSYEEGLVYYDTSNKALTVLNDEANIALQVGQEEWIRVFNNSGNNILNGKPVYITGESNGLPTIALASAQTEAESYAIGLATHDIYNNDTGYVTVRGVVRDINTSGLTAGQRAHISPTAGVLQNSAPTYPYFPTDVGTVLVSDASFGMIYVDVTPHVTETLRVTDDARVDGDMVVAGNLSVFGTQSIISVGALAVDNSFIYTNSGDTIGATNTNFTGTGQDDGVFTGHYEGTTANKTYYVRIDGVGTGTGGVDTFEWSLDNFSSTEATGVDITGSDQSLEDGINIKFNATTGHTSGDKWDGTASPVNVDTGIVSNRNTGTSGVGYTHLGMFFDISDEKFKFFDAYAPEPTGDIDVGNASFSLGTVVASTFEGDVTGDLTGDVTGDVTGTVSSLANHTTSNLTEGTNLYYTTTRANTAIDNRVTQTFVNALNVNADTLDSQDGSYYLNATNINDGTLASARLPDLTVADFAGSAVQLGSESFSDSDTVLMTAAAVQDKIESYSYSTISGITAGVGLSGGGSTGSISLALDFSELTDMTADISGTTEFILQNGTTESRKAASEIKLSAFDNDSGWTSNTGDITNVTAGNYLTGGGSSGDVTLDVDATSDNTASTVVARDASGNFSAGIITATATSARYADLAEKYATDTNYEPGTVVCFGGNAEVTVVSKYESTTVAGVISTDPAYMMNNEADGQYVALRGRVPCKVVGIVKPGDVLVTSEIPGYAVASSSPHMVPAAAMIGKAIGRHDGNGPGLIEVLV